MYDYPILHLLFFSVVAVLPFPLLVSKTIITLFDLVNFFLIRSNNRVEKIACFYLIVSTPFTSLEGQVVSITIFLFLISIHLYQSDHQRLGFFFIGIGFQWKIIGVILVPYYVLKDFLELRTNKGSINDYQELLFRLLCFLIPFGLLTIIPLLFSGYLLNSMFFNFLFIHHAPQNPMYLPGLLSSSLLLVLTIGFIVVNWINLRGNWKEGVHYLLLLELSFFLLFYRLASPWV